MTDDRETNADVLANFVVSETLQENTLAKTISLLGTFSDGREGQAIVRISRRPFTTEDTQRMARGVACRQQQFQNDVYSKVRSHMDECQVSCRPEACQSSAGEPV